LSFYMQQILGYSPLKTGMLYLPFGLTVIVAAGIAQALATKIGIRTTLAVGLLMVAAAQLWFSRAPVDGSYLTDLLPGFIVGALGLGFSFVPVTIAALQGVKQDEAGVASGLINTSQQIGGALGVAVLLTIAVTTFTPLLVGAGITDPNDPAARPFLLEGYHSAFFWGAMMSLLGFLATLVAIRPAVGTDVDAELQAMQHDPAGETA